jgi:hypothetical protein
MMKRLPVLLLLSGCVPPAPRDVAGTGGGGTGWRGHLME